MRFGNTKKSNQPEKTELIISYFSTSLVNKQITLALELKQQNSFRNFRRHHLTYRAPC